MIENYDFQVNKKQIKSASKNLTILRAMKINWKVTGELTLETKHFMERKLWCN